MFHYLKDSLLETPVILVGNKTDQCGDRMVAIEEGQKRFREISCASFHEISCRESVKQVWHSVCNIFGWVNI